MYNEYSESKFISFIFSWFDQLDVFNRNSNSGYMHVIELTKQ